MTHAYADEYLNDAMRNLGEAFDYVANACKISLDDFMKLFIASGYADSFGKGNPKIVVGMSGTELAMQVLEKSGKIIDYPNSQIEYDCSSEYWCGYILAFYQWSTCRTFRNIYDYISMEDVNKLYGVLHEAPEEKFIDVVNAIIKRKTTSTRLQSMRKKVGYSQRELAEKSGVNLRTLQQYELGAKDINKASIQNVTALANALGCEIEDIIEYSNNETE